MKRLIIAAMAMVTASCAEDVAAPSPRALLLTGEPTFYRFDATAFAHAPREAGFWAVKGERRQLVLRYTDTNSEFMRFDVGGESLSRRPDGTVIQDGDSVFISVRVDPAGDMIFRFSPSGLKFESSDPARLIVNYARSNPDINRNGSVGLDDVLAELTAAIWKQELPLLPWLKLPTLNLSGDIARTDVHDFTGFGMAVN